MAEERSHVVLLLVWFVCFVWKRIYSIKTMICKHGNQDKSQDSVCLVSSRMPIQGVRPPPNSY